MGAVADWFLPLLLKEAKMLKEMLKAKKKEKKDKKKDKK